MKRGQNTDSPVQFHQDQLFPSLYLFLGKAVVCVFTYLGYRDIQWRDLETDEKADASSQLELRSTDSSGGKKPKKIFNEFRYSNHREKIIQKSPKIKVVQLTGLLESHRNKFNLDVNILCCEKKLVFSPELLDFLLKKSSFLPIKNINCTQKYTFIICNIMTDVIHPVNSYLSICSCYSCLRVLHLMFTLRCLNCNQQGTRGDQKAALFWALQV